MIGLDTNILVRLLVNDDQEQNNQIVKRLEEAERNGEQLFVSKLVLIETIWVLNSVYGFKSDKIVNALEVVSQIPSIEFEDIELFHKLSDDCLKYKAGLADQLIRLDYLKNGCDLILSFDKKLGQLEKVEKP